MSCTWEFGSSFHEQCQAFEDAIDKNFRALEYLANIAPQPYSLCQGPDIQSVRLSEEDQEAAANMDVTLTIQIQEPTETIPSSSSLQDVVEIRAFMEHPLVHTNALPVWSWDVVTTHVNNWNKDDRTFEITLSRNDVLFARGAGNHTLYIQAKGSTGSNSEESYYWGPVAAVPLSVNGNNIPSSSAAATSSLSTPTTSKSNRPSSAPVTAPEETERLVDIDPENQQPNEVESSEANEKEIDTIVATETNDENWLYPGTHVQEI